MQILPATKSKKKREKIKGKLTQSYEGIPGKKEWKQWMSLAGPQPEKHTGIAAVQFECTTTHW